MKNEVRHTPQSKYQLCFNPACPNPSARLFTSPDSHFPSCRKWIIDRRKCLLLANPKPAEAHSYKQTALMHTSPIDSLLRFYEWREDAIRNVSCLYEKMRQEVVQFIDCSKASKLREIQFLTKEMDSFRGLIMESMRLADLEDIQKDGAEFFKKTSMAIHNLLNSYRYSIPVLKDLVIYDKDRFQEITVDIKERLKTFNDSVCSEVQLAGGFERLKYQDMQGAEMILGRLEQIGDSLYKLLGWGEGDYLVERNGRVVEWRCPLCKLRLQAPQAQSSRIRIECQRMMAQHLIEAHYLQLSLCYSHRISRSVVEELPYSELIRMMQLYQYDELDIYDAANSKNLRYECNPRCLTVLFTPANANKEDFQHCFCIANTPEEAAFKITLIISEVCLSMRKAVRLFNFKRNYYTLYTGITNSYGADCKFEERVHTVNKTKTLKREN